MGEAMMVMTYAVYVVVSLAITIWVGRTLNRNGRIFLVENFEGREALADSINHLLLIGFYLVNIGFVSLALRYGTKPVDIVGAVEFLSTKIGLVIVVLGGMHFFNMHMLVKFRHTRLFQSVAGASESDQGTVASDIQLKLRPQV
jgi:protein-S-isoprenylcysteine O-methyltransferase Ste14